MADKVDDILHKHLDGDLTESEHLGLLNSLQHDSELRADLAELEMVRDMARESHSAVTVPAAQTEKLYGALGYSIPSEPIAAIPAWMRYGAVAAAASLITAGVMSIDSSTGGNNPESATAQNIAAQTEQGSTTSDPVATSSAMLPTDLQTNQQEVVHVERSQAPTAVNSVKEPVGTTPASEKQSHVATSVNSAETIEVAEHNAVQSAANESLNLQPIGRTLALASSSVADMTIQDSRLQTIHASAPSFGVIEEANGAFSLSYRTINSTSDVAVDVPTQTINQAYAVTIGYELDDNLTLLVEGGQEHFAQRFMTTTDAGRPVEIQQQPFVTWLTAGARYEMPLMKLNSDILISPFVQTTAGAAFQQGNGFLGRGVVGTVIQPLSWFKVVAGWEYSTFVYTTASGSESTVNNGLTIGGMIQLR